MHAICHMCDIVIVVFASAGLVITIYNILCNNRHCLCDFLICIYTHNSSFKHVLGIQYTSRSDSLNLNSC